MEKEKEKLIEYTWCKAIFDWMDRRRKNIWRNLDVQEPD